MLWEMDVFDVLGLCRPGDAAHQHLVAAAKDSLLQRIGRSPDAWSPAVLTMLQVTPRSPLARSCSQRVVAMAGPSAAGCLQCGEPASQPAPAHAACCQSSAGLDSC